MHACQVQHTCVKPQQDLWLQKLSDRPVRGYIINKWIDSHQAHSKSIWEVIPSIYTSSCLPQYQSLTASETQNIHMPYTQQVDSRCTFVKWMNESSKNCVPSNHSSIMLKILVYQNINFSRSMAQKKTITFSYIFLKTQPCNITAWKYLDVNVCNLKKKKKNKTHG